MIPALRSCQCPRGTSASSPIGTPPTPHHSSRAGVRLLLTPSGVVQCPSCLGLRFPPQPPYRVTFAGKMVGRTYLEHGEPVTVLAQWAGTGCPRNVVIADASGATSVRPARGLRRPN